MTLLAVMVIIREHTFCSTLENRSSAYQFDELRDAVDAEEVLWMGCHGENGSIQRTESPERKLAIGTSDVVARFTDSPALLWPLADCGIR